MKRTSLELPNSNNTRLCQLVTLPVYELHSAPLMQLAKTRRSECRKVKKTVQLPVNLHRVVHNLIRVPTRAGHVGTRPSAANQHLSNVIGYEPRASPN